MYTISQLAKSAGVNVETIRYYERQNLIEQPNTPLRGYRQYPEATLTKLCTRIDLPFSQKMLSWPRGPKPYDGIWASHWYGAVHQSTTFAGPDSEHPVLSAEFEHLVAHSQPYYDKLKTHTL